jgi:hypothetical protein
MLAAPNILSQRYSAVLKPDAECAAAAVEAEAAKSLSRRRLPQFPTRLDVIAGDVVFQVFQMFQMYVFKCFI